MSVKASCEEEMIATIGIADGRETPRTTCRGTAVEIATLGFFPRILSGTLQDRSPMRLCVHLKRRLKKGAEIATVIDDELIFGRVEYTAPILDAIKTGIQIRYTIRPSDSASDLSRLANALG
jgi:hypothetical protein